MRATRSTRTECGMATQTRPERRRTVLDGRRNRAGLGRRVPDGSLARQHALRRNGTPDCRVLRPFEPASDPGPSLHHDRRVRSPVVPGKRNPPRSQCFRLRDQHLRRRSRRAPVGHLPMRLFTLFLAAILPAMSMSADEQPVARRRLTNMASESSRACPSFIAQPGAQLCSSFAVKTCIPSISATLPQRTEFRKVNFGGSSALSPISPPLRNSSNGIAPTTSGKAPCAMLGVASAGRS